MAKNIVITVDAQSGAVVVNNDTIGAVGENLQGQFIVEFKEVTDYISGVCWLEIKNGEYKGYINLTPMGKIYVAPIKSGITNCSGKIKAQIRITQSGEESDIPIFKSDVFNLKTLESINALEEIPDEYPEWIETANAKLAEIEGVNARLAELEKSIDNSGKRTYVTTLTKDDFKRVGISQKYYAVILKSEHGLTNPYIEKALLVSAKDSDEEYTFDTPVVVGEKTLSTGTVKVYITINDFMERYEEYKIKVYLKGE